MRRAILTTLAALAALLALASTALAAAPTAGPVSATNIQGVSALVKGTVDPGGVATTYSFQYIDDAGFGAGGFDGATETAPTTAGQGNGPQPARAAISGLRPSTGYHVRLTATNSSGSASSEATFETSAGFGFLPGAEGFGVEAIADGDTVANVAGSHPYQVNVNVGLRPGGEFEGQPGAVFPDGDLRDLSVEAPPGFILNPSVLPFCFAAEFSVSRTSPFELSQAGESCPTPLRSAPSMCGPRAAAAKCAASASSTCNRPRASPPSSASPPSARRSSSTSA